MIFNTAYYWGIPARILHWLGAAMILFLYVHGLLVGDEAEQVTPGTPAATTGQIFAHAAVGATLAVLMLGRYVWRLINKIPMLPAKSPEWEKKAAALAHVGLYICTFVAIVAGWLLAGARQPPLEVKVLGVVPVPTLDVLRNDAARRLLSEIHEFAAHLLIAVVVLHIIAALWHHYVQRDGVLKRMLLRGRNRRAGT